MQDGLESGILQSSAEFIRWYRAALKVPGGGMTLSEDFRTAVSTVWFPDQNRQKILGSLLRSTESKILRCISQAFQVILMHTKLR